MARAHVTALAASFVPGVRVSVHHYGAVAITLETARRWQEALQLISSCREPNQAGGLVWPLGLGNKTLKGLGSEDASGKGREWIPMSCHVLRE